MIERRAIEPITLRNRATDMQDDTPRKPRLSMSWSLDPATGKLVARWTAEPVSIDWSKFFATAA